MSPDRREKPHRAAAPRDPPEGLGPYLTIGGRGEPAGSLYEAKVSALYSVVYTIKLGMGRAGRDFTIAGLEGFWAREPSGVRVWKLGIRAPNNLTPLDLSEAIANLAAKGKDPLVKDVLLESLDERQVERFSLGLSAVAAGS